MLPRPIFQHVNIKPSFPFKTEKMKADSIFCHWHPYVEIIYIEEGATTLSVDSKTISLEKGDIAIINPNEVHYATPCGSNACVVQYVVFSYDILSMEHQNHIFIKYIEPLKKNRLLYPNKIDKLEQTISKRDSGWVNDCHHHVKNLMKHGLSEFEGKEIALQGDLISLIASLYQAEAFLEASALPSAPIMAKEKKIIRYFEENFTKDIDIPSVAKIFSISEDHFYKVFKKTTGHTPIGYLHRLRINHAQYLLKTTSLTISEIGFQVGFDSTSYFIKVFKKITSTTPKTFRMSI